jgi:predicted AlkP superfamily phosphohydrolase/phosphomutase
MTARVLVIALDAAEATLLERWADSGALPNLKRILSASAGFKVGNSLKTLPGAIWPELATGISCAKRAQYYHPAQLHTGEAERRPILASEVDGEEYYWTHAARAGLKVAALDMPQTVLARAPDCLQLLEWGLHDRHMGEGGTPEGFAASIHQRYGAHPVRRCDSHGRSPEGYGSLLENLKRGVRAKTQILDEAMRQTQWDLFTATFGECHCVGHQFWHFQDPAHPWYRPDAPREFQTAIGDVYGLIDEGIGALIEAAGPGCIIVAVASHGMGNYTGGPYLLTEIIARLGLNGSSETPLAAVARSLKTGQDPLSQAARALVRTVLPRKQLSRAQAELGVLHHPLVSSATRATDLPNNRCGAIRLNLKGREPFGSVAPGNEATAILEDIRAALEVLREPRSGAPIVEKVMTAHEAFGPVRHPDVPDLIVVFHDDLGRLEECFSPQLGTIRAPIYRADLPRSGDHTTQSRIWIAGPGIATGRLRETGNVLDLAPTVLSLLKVARPPGLDGRPLLNG